MTSPLTLNAWTHRRDGIRAPGGAAALRAWWQWAWSKFRGPGRRGRSATAAPSIDEKTGQSTTTASFSAAGEYLLRVQVNDATGEGGGGFQCCWTNTHVKVTVTGQ